MNTLLLAGCFLGVGGSIVLVIALDIDKSYPGDRRELVRLAKFGAAAAIVGWSIVVACTCF